MPVLHAKIITSVRRDQLIRYDVPKGGKRTEGNRRKHITRLYYTYCTYTYVFMHVKSKITSPKLEIEIVNYIPIS